MRDFQYYAPTKVVFGASSEERIGELILNNECKRVLLHYGGKSAERSGLLDVVRRSLTDAKVGFVELGGVVPNPRLSKVREGIELCRKEKVDFILAVGGGSVIDSAKAISAGVPYSGDVWDFFSTDRAPQECLPIGVVLTIPAAGSEMSGGCVITKEEGQQKRSFDSNKVRPVFAVMNPERTTTLPPFQTACGITDIMMHTMERYFSHDNDMNITDAIAEAIVRTVKECARPLLDNPNDYRLRAQIMWAGSLAHNDLTGCGLAGDWATHMLEHELSALFDVAHGAGLAALWTHWARYVMKEDVTRFAQFAVRVMGVPQDFSDAEATALRGIEAMADFYRSIGMPTNIKELIGRNATEDELRTLAEKCSLGKTETVGQFKVLNYNDMYEIYKAANQ